MTKKLPKLVEGMSKIEIKEGGTDLQKGGNTE